MMDNGSEQQVCTYLSDGTDNRPHPDLANYTPTGFSRGRSAFTLALWILVDVLLISSWLPGSWHRRALLRSFGARIGRGVVIKPRVRVKFPWRLAVGEHSWIGEDVWIDNLTKVSIGTDCCVSQGAYLCTGSHNWSRASFDLITKPITIEDGVWIGARALVGPGVRADTGAVLCMGGVANTDLKAWTVYNGNPASPIRQRQ